MIKTPEPGEGKRGEDGYLGYLLRQAAAAHRLRMDKALADLRMTPPQFAVLTMLRAYPGLSNAELARLALLTPQTVSLIVANLERSGLVKRSQHETHGRVQPLALSDEGAALLARATARVVALEAALREGVAAEDERVVRRWLARAAVARGENERE